MAGLFLRFALRSMRRRPGFTVLNVAGLALGLGCCLLIALYVRDETGYDQFNPRADRIVRVSQELTAPGREALWSWTGGAMGEDLAADFPQIEAVVRVLKKPGSVQVAATPGQRFREEGVLFADARFFDVFAYRFVRGDAATALQRPDGIVLTAATATRYFGQEDPLGQVLTYDGTLPLTVTGVVEDPPATTHLPFSHVAPMAAFKGLQGLPADANFGSYWWPTVWTYLLLPSAEEAARLQAQLPAFTVKHRQDSDYLPTLESLTELHFSAAEQAPGPAGSRALVRVFIGIALAVLLLACLNMINLTTAQSTTRAREVGLRKAVGAGRGSLVFQFVGEALLVCVGAALVALGLVSLGLPAFNALAGTQLSLQALTQPEAWGGLVAVVVLTGVAAGLYPALVLTRYRPARVLRGTFVGAQGARLRKSLVVVQFTVAIVLAAMATIGLQQLHFLRSAPLGFDEEQLVTLRLPGKDWAPLKAALEARPEVLGVTSSGERPGFGSGIVLPYEAGAPAPSPDPAPRMGLAFVDYGYIETLKLDVVAGRGFSRAHTADEGVRSDSTPYGHLDGLGLLVNRTAARRLGWSDEEAIGKPLRFYAYENGTYYTDYRGTVVGVVADYHTASFEQSIEPIAFKLIKSPLGYTPTWALVKVRPGEAAGTLAALRAVWDKVLPDAPFEAAFLDADLDARYERQARLGAVMAAFALLGGFIACLGLFGLAAFAAEQRRREVGIRKVLGATVPGLVWLLARDFVALVSVASILAVPLAWWAASRWLDGFAYRIEVGPLPFAVVAVATLGIALATVSGQAIRATTADPVKALRTE